tara:strand:+ start:214 stop:537 length:324 start_codon:yes stop_codon:yes gene_type:complete
MSWSKFANVDVYVPSARLAARANDALVDDTHIHFVDVLIPPMKNGFDDMRWRNESQLTPFFFLLCLCAHFVGFSFVQTYFALRAILPLADYLSWLCTPFIVTQRTMP